MKKYSQWLAIVMIITLAFGTMYVLAQQVLRQSANDPQVQLAYDTASLLQSGATVESLTGTKIDAGPSLAPFIIIFDKSGKEIGSTATIDGKPPVFPADALKTSDSQGYYAVTWQPKSSLRYAAVAVAGKDYYVVSARSLFLIEKREDQVLLLTMAGWGASVLIFLSMIAVPQKMRPKQS